MPDLREAFGEVEDRLRHRRVRRRPRRHERVGAGETGVVLIAAVVKKGAGVVFNYTKALFEQEPSLRPLVAVRSHGFRLQQLFFATARAATGLLGNAAGNSLGH